MTPGELDRDQPITEESRIRRIAKGSGTSEMEVKILLEEHKKLKGLIGQVGKTNIGKGANEKLNLTRNPNQVMGKLQQMMTPQMMSQLGGAGNIMNMMKEMSNNPQMEEMMKSMGMGGAGKKKGGRK
jgi:signal recognition particle subunit SRP54